MSKRQRPPREPVETERRRATLADRFIHRRFAEWERAVHPKTITQLQKSAREARRFILSEDATRRLTEVVMSIPDLLVREHQFARAPYDLTWVEFPSHIMWAMFQERNPEAYVNLGKWGDPALSDYTIGYLIDHERVNVIVGGTVEDPDTEPNILPIQYRIHTPWSEEGRVEYMRRAGVVVEEERGTGRAVTSPYRRGKNLHAVAIDSLLWGSTWNNLTQESRDNVVGRNTAEFLPSNPLHKNHDRWTGDGEMSDAARGSMGELRNIIAILLMMNRPSITRYVHTNDRSRGFHKGKLMPFLSHTTVTIDTDARPTLRLIGTPAGDGVGRRRGEVRGHYKHDRAARDFSRIAGCIHEFQSTHGPEDDWAPWPDPPPGIPGDPGGVRNWVCSECGGKRWFVKDHERGDASIGYVVKDGYEVD